ncbi:hypothetical protein K458DRAFT_297205 [Lentithecium fluviatile CBS 122367]|uniref:Homeobox domain-containing protein n=1 Tax=Lentithecium fluviatile CBS 122367 TaxID=1168545 RepID=A0A6G1J8V6_9PLEO|nr:hypothetical protein K458DRAFT_297205 [Lentithecium fluviatile CBS 122367]
MSSSPAPSARSSPAAASASLAFLVHSPTTVANSLPPDVDNKPLARQKRRRTSKEDEEILKAEYERNPKPDKAARMAIVSKVALGEKEVQVWFQNKRQNDRRRSRPLDTSSIPSLMSSSSLMSDPSSEDDVHTRDNDTSDEQKDPEEADIEEAAQVENAPTAAPATPTEEAVEEPRAVEAADAAVPAESAKASSPGTAESSIVPSTDPHTAETAPTELSSSQQTLPSSQSASQSRTSWISNRRSASFMRNSDDYAPETITFPNNSQESTARALKRTHSFVRISTNEDGTARVVTDLDKTPSPPHARTNTTPFSRAAAGLRRSYSAAGLNDRLTAVAREERSPKLPRTASNIGRSRDSRAWEFWCDPDTRYNTSLTTRAEQEGSGSAADAIGLLRANRKILAQNHARQNSPVVSRQAPSKMSHENGVKKSRGPMQRASTISGRLQSKDGKKVSDCSDTESLPQTESDKENWEPEQPQMRRPRQTGHAPESQRPRQILGENSEIMSQSTSLGNLLARETGNTPSKSGRKGSDPEQDEELMFMNNGDASARTTVSSAEEAGCVEGLLKLSQGQWK